MGRRTNYTSQIHFKVVIQFLSLYKRMKKGTLYVAARKIKMVAYLKKLQLDFLKFSSKDLREK